MHSASKPWWQQATALVSLSTSGAITGFSFVPAAPADLATPTSLPIHLLALQKSAQPAPANDQMLRSAVVNVAHYYQRLATQKTPAEMEALIWQRDSIDGTDHGASCAAFASLTLELGAQVVGQQSWVTGGSTYPWPLHTWADVRVDPNPASLGITSILQDAQAHHRWHPLGDGYQPLPGDWVLFNGHVEVVTKYAGGVLDTIGGDSMPNFSVNAHQYPGPLGAQGVVGFVNNGGLSGTAGATPSGGGQVTGRSGLAPGGGQAPGSGQVPRSGGQVHGGGQVQVQAAPGQAAIPGAVPVSAAGAAATRQAGGAAARSGPVPGTATPAQRARPEQQRAQVRMSPGHRVPLQASAATAGSARVPGAAMPGPVTLSRAATAGAAAIPGLSVATHHRPDAHTAPYARHQLPPAATTLPGTTSQQAFINEIAAGAISAQHTYGVPASVTIAQAIDESAWGQSELAARDHNLFGIKGKGPAGSDWLPTQEYQNNQYVNRIAAFRVYHNVAQSIDDHGKLLATSVYYRRSMAQSQNPNAFASSLTGVYATDPSYGAKLIQLMQHYDLYRYNTAGSSAANSNAPARAAAPTAIPRSPAPAGAATPVPTRPGVPTGTPATPQPTAPGGRTAPPATSQPAAPSGSPTPTSSPQPTGPGGSFAPTLAPVRGAPTPPATPQPAAPGGSPVPASPPQPAASSGTPAARPSTPRAAAPGATPGAQSATPGGAVPQTRPGNAAAGQPASIHPASGQRVSGQPASGGGGSTSAGNRQGGATGGATTPAAASGGAGPAVLPQSGPGGAMTSPAASPGGAAIPGLAQQPAQPARAPRSAATPSAQPEASSESAAYQSGSHPTTSVQTVAFRRAPAAGCQTRRAGSRSGRTAPALYQQHIPQSVRSAFVATAKVPLLRAEPLYRDIASHTGIRWELLAACDWMQCKAQPRHSPVHGEKLGTANPDGTIYRTKSEALDQCADDLVGLAQAVYRLDVTRAEALSVRDLANVFAAFRWGGLLLLHRTSAMEFPYSVAGLTGQHLNMRWPNIAEPNAPDKPGGRFRMPIGAVPIVLGLNYPATV